jgi:hypothetical protein
MRERHLPRHLPLNFIGFVDEMRSRRGRTRKHARQIIAKGLTGGAYP